MTYVSYTGWQSIISGYPGLAGKTLTWSLMLMGVNSMVPEAFDLPGYEIYRPSMGTMEYCTGKDWYNGYNVIEYFDVLPYKEYWGDTSGGASIAIFPWSMPNPESVGYQDYWSIHVRGRLKYPGLGGSTGFSIYNAFLLGAVV